jgi:DNA-binding PadR family transcriptional regulator
MLTPANTFLLGLIAHKPINPYDIINRFAYNRYNATLQIPDSTIYSNIRTMCKKGFITYTLSQESGMPPKKMYTITDLGLVELKETIRKYLSDYCADWSGFTTALLLMHHFSKEELLQFLNQRKQVLKELQKHRDAECQFCDTMHKDIPCIPNVASALHVAIHMREELYVTMTVISILEKTEKWPQSTFDADAIYQAQWDALQSK